MTKHQFYTIKVEIQSWLGSVNKVVDFVANIFSSPGLFHIPLAGVEWRDVTAELFIVSSFHSDC